MKSLAYAEKAVQDASPPARIFNCRQRTYTLLCRRMAVLTAHMCTGAHANTLENAPCVITLCVPQSIHPTISIYAQIMLRSLLSGLRYPTFTALSVDHVCHPCSSPGRWLFRSRSFCSHRDAHHARSGGAPCVPCDCCPCREVVLRVGSPSW